MEKNDFLQVLEKYDDPIVNRNGVNAFDELVLQSEDKEVRFQLLKLISLIIQDDLFEFSERALSGLLIFLNQAKLEEREIILQLKELSEKYFSKNLRFGAIIIRFIASYDTSLVNRGLVFNSPIKETDFWLWADIIFRISELQLLRSELLKHFRHGSNDFNSFIKRIIYWKMTNTSVILDSIINDIYSIMPIVDKKDMVDLIEKVLKVKINVFDGPEFIESYYKTNVSNIFRI